MAGCPPYGCDDVDAALLFNERMFVRNTYTARYITSRYTHISTMPLSEADISATPIDDGKPQCSLSSRPLTSPQGSFPPTAQPKDPNDRSYAPRSPQPKLVLFNPRSGETETIDLGPSSSVMTLEDYRNLNRQTTRRGMLTGLIGGGLLSTSQDYQQDCKIKLIACSISCEEIQAYTS